MKPVFICGTGRSGTSVLKRTLNNHSKIISIGTELRVIVDPGGALDLVNALSDRWSPYNADYAIHSFKKLMGECATSNKLMRLERHIFRRIGISPRRYLGVGIADYLGGKKHYFARLDELIEQLTYYISIKGNWTGTPALKLPSIIYETAPQERDAIEQVVEQYFHDLYDTHIESANAIYWCEDTPTNLLHVSELKSLFPEARFIHIYRNPRDVLSSYLKKAWGGDFYVATARRIASMYETWFRERERIPSASYLEISLEEIVSNSSNAMHKLCDFLDLDFESTLVTKSELASDRLHAGRFQQDFKPDDLEQIDKFLRPYIDAYGYK